MFYGKKNAMNELCNNDLFILLFYNDFKRFKKKKKSCYQILKSQPTYTDVTIVNEESYIKFLNLNSKINSLK